LQLDISGKLKKPSCPRLIDLQLVAAVH